MNLHVRTRACMHARACTHTIKNYTFERGENFKYLGVVLNEDNNHQIYLQERIKNANKTYLMLQISLEIKIYIKN